MDDDEDLSGAINLQLTIIAKIESPPLRRRFETRETREARAWHFAAHQILIWDYFWQQPKLIEDGSLQYGPPYTNRIFGRLFRMPRHILERLFAPVTGDIEYLRAGVPQNCAVKLGITPIQKVVSALRQLTYGVDSHPVDEYVCIG